MKAAPPLTWLAVLLVLALSPTDGWSQALTRQKHATEKSRQQHILERDEKEEKAATDVPRINSPATAGR